MKTFHQFLTEDAPKPSAPPPSSSGPKPPSGPEPSIGGLGGLGGPIGGPPIGGIGGGPPMGGMGGPSLSGPPGGLGGGLDGPPPNQAPTVQKIKSQDVWSVLKKSLKTNKSGQKQES